MAVPRRKRDSDDEDEDDTALAGQRSMDARAQYVEVSIQQAMRRGDFDELPGAGKPIPGLGGVKDPDWWIRRKIERERITGLGPPALTLRTESAGSTRAWMPWHPSMRCASISTTSTAASSKHGGSCWAVRRWSRQPATSSWSWSAGGSGGHGGGYPARGARRARSAGR